MRKWTTIAYLHSFFVDAIHGMRGEQVIKGSRQRLSPTTTFSLISHPQLPVACLSVDAAAFNNNNLN